MIESKRFDLIFGAASPFLLGQAVRCAQTGAIPLAVAIGVVAIASPWVIREVSPWIDKVIETNLPENSITETVKNVVKNCWDSMFPTYPIQGIDNGGNNCYMIAALQVLVNDDTFIHLLETIEKNEEPKKRFSSDQKKLFELLGSFVKSYKEQGSDLHQKMIEIRNTLHKMHPQSFPDKNAQYDSVEMIGYIFNALEVPQFGLSQRLIRGSESRFLSIEPGNILPISVQKTSLKENVEDFFAQEKLDNCEVKYFLESAPKTLVLQLKRFNSDGTKIGKGIEIDPVLDLTPFLKYSSEKKARYELSSIIYHMGETIDHGHYVASVKSNGSWYFCNDGVIRGCEPSEVENAYGLVFKRIN